MSVWAYRILSLAEPGHDCTATSLRDCALLWRVTGDE